MATQLTSTHDTTVNFEDQSDSFEEFELLDEAELSVTRTPKSIVFPLVIAVATCLLAYLQAPETVKVHRQRLESPTAIPTKQALQNVQLDDHWTTAEVAPMPLGLDG